MQSAAYDNPIASENVSILILWLATNRKPASAYVQVKTETPNGGL